MRLKMQTHAIMKFVFYTFVYFISINAFAQIKLLETSDFKKIVGNKQVQIVDVRTPYEYNSGHIQGAINIDYYGDHFKEELNKLDKSIPIYFYCHSGVRSAKAAKMMKEMGFSKIYDLKGGIVAWKKEGEKLVK